MQNADSIDLQAIARQALLDRGFRVDFPQSVLKETEHASEPDFGSLAIRDMTGKLWSSIDNDDSRDLDQAEYVETNEDGHVSLYVAIANVSHYVPEGSATDDAARINTTSIYTGVETFPMLPVRLSNDLSSLNEDQDRLAVVTQMDMNSHGVSHTTVYPAVVRNRAQLTYTGVAAFIEGQDGQHSAVTQRVLSRIGGDPALQEQLRVQDRIAQTLREDRLKEGALDLQTPELRPSLNPDGSVELSSHETNHATQLIEEFMIASNKAVATLLDQEGLPCIQRVVRSPKNWSRIVALADEHGWALPGQPDGEALQAFLATQRAKDPERFPDLSLAIIKLLGRGEYVVKVPGETGQGHFGLGAENYMHGTAGNRRYADLGDQRIILSSLAGKRLPYTLDELERLAQWCTSREGDAKKVERQVHKCIAAVALAPRIGETFPGFITGSAEKGVYVRIPYPPVEGKVCGHVGGLEVGHKVRVRLIHTDPYLGHIDFEVVSR